MSGYTEVFAWGGDHYGQLGLASKHAGKTYNSPRYCSFNVFIKDISCGEEHSAFVTINGEVYTMGNNAEGRLGIGNRGIKQCASPCLVETLSGRRAISVSCGWGHTAIVTDSGQLFTWGSGEHGALGLGTTETLWIPAQVNLSQDLTPLTVSCGARHTAVIAQTRTGYRELWTCGAGEAGQLGTGRREKELLFVRISFSDAVKQVSCGVFHTGFLTPTGRVYMMGGNSFGQLGVGSKKSSSLPQRVTALDLHPIIKVSCGHHSAAVSDRGELYLWGTGSFGEYLVPQLISNIPARVADVSVGGSFGSAVDVDNGLWTWGSNTNGELGVGDYEPRLTPFSVSQLQGKRIRQIACGSSFCIALGQDIGVDDSSSQSAKRGKRTLSQSVENAQNRASHSRSGTTFGYESATSPLRPKNQELSVEKETLKGYYSDVKGELSRLKDTAGGVNDLSRRLEDVTEKLEDSLRRLDREVAQRRRLEDELLEERRKRELDQSEMETELQNKEKDVSVQRNFAEKVARERSEFEHLFIDRDNQMRQLQSSLDHSNASLLDMEATLRTKDKEFNLLKSAHEHVVQERDRLSDMMHETESHLEDLGTRIEKLEDERQTYIEQLTRKDGELASFRVTFDREKRVFDEKITVGNRDLIEAQHRIDALEQKKRTMDTDFASIQRDQDALRQERNSVLSEAKTLREKLTLKESELISLRRDFDVISRERKLDLNHLNQLQDLIASREGEIETAKTDLEKTVRDREIIAEEGERLKGQVRQLLGEKDQISTNLELQIRSFAVLKGNFEENQRKFDSDLKRKEEDHMGIIGKLREGYETKTGNLLRQLSESEDRNNRLKQDCEELVGRVRRLEDALNILKDRSESEIKRKEEEKTRTVETYEGKLAGVLRDLGLEKETQLQLRRELESAEDRYRKMEEELHLELSRCDSDLKRQSTEQMYREDSYEGRIATLSKQLVDEQTQKRLVLKDLESARLSIQRLEDLLQTTQDQAKSELKRLENDSKLGYNQLMESYETKIAQVRSDNKRLEAESRTSYVQMQENYESKLAQAKTDLKRLENDSKLAFTQMQESFEAKISGLTKALSEEKDRRNLLEKDLGIAGENKRKLEDVIGSQQRKGDALNREGEELRHLISEKDQEMQELLKDLEVSRSKERELVGEREELQKEIERRSGQVARLQNDVQVREEEETANGETISTLTQETNQLKSTIEELKYEIEALYQQNHDNLSAMDKLHEVNEDLNEKYQNALQDIHELQVQITELEAKNREIFINFEKDISTRAKEFKERTLSVLGTPSPLRTIYQSSSPPPQKRASIHSSAVKSSLATATSVSKQLDKYRDESPERRIELGLRPEVDTTYQQRISRAAERLMDSLGRASPISSMRLTSPMRQSLHESSRSPLKQARVNQSPTLPRETGSFQDFRAKFNSLRASKAAIDSRLQQMQQRFEEDQKAPLSNEDVGT